MTRNRAYLDIVQTVFNTPLVRLNRIIPRDQAAVFVKLEFFNPLSSVKDRIGRAMIEAAEQGRHDQAGDAKSSSRPAATPGSPWRSSARPRAIG